MGVWVQHDLREGPCLYSCLFVGRICRLFQNPHLFRSRTHNPVITPSLRAPPCPQADHHLSFYERLRVGKRTGGSSDCGSGVRAAELRSLRNLARTSYGLASLPLLRPAPQRHHLDGGPAIGATTSRLAVNWVCLLCCPPHHPCKPPLTQAVHWLAKEFPHVLTTPCAVRGLQWPPSPPPKTLFPGPSLKPSPPLSLGNRSWRSVRGTGRGQHGAG